MAIKLAVLQFLAIALVLAAMFNAAFKFIFVVTNLAVLK